ncbi:MAG TPA: queuosine precursor transporter [Steroidobacteraceae bacterium]|nr:queuosine precursor transporter [Steroidobacteraceae bacterium]
MFAPPASASPNNAADGQVISAHVTDHRATRLLVILTSFFVADALIAEFVGVKIFALEQTFGVDVFNWQLFGQQGSLSFTAGVLLWPIVFVMTDIVNEFFGPRGVRFISWLAVALISYAFLAAYLAISLAPADWWVTVNQAQGVPDMQKAFGSVFGQGMWTIVGSIVAFLVGQLIDVHVFHAIRRATGERRVWMRATGSTLVSQLVDSFVVLYIAFVLGPQQWSMGLFLAVGTVNYCYKAIMAVLMTPVIYGARWGVRRYLGVAQASEMEEAAARPV